MWLGDEFKLAETGVGMGLRDEPSGIRRKIVD